MLLTTTPTSASAGLYYTQNGGLEAPKARNGGKEELKDVGKSQLYALEFKAMAINLAGLPAGYHALR